MLVYLREPLKEGSPSVEYEEIVVESAKQLSLPSEYIDTYLRVRKDEK